MLSRREMLEKAGAALLSAEVTGDIGPLPEVLPTLYVLHLDKPIPPQTRCVLAECWQRAFDGKAPRLIILEPGMRLEAVKGPKED